MLCIKSGWIWCFYWIVFLQFRLYVSIWANRRRKTNSFYSSPFGFSSAEWVFGVAKPARRQVYCLQFWTVRWFARSLAGWQEWDMCMYAVRRMRCFISLFFNVSWFLYFHFNSFQFNSNSTYLFFRLLLLLTASPFSRWYLHIDDDAAATATAKSNSRKNTIIVNDNNILVNSIELPFPLRHPSSLPPSAVRLCIEFAMFCWRFYFSSAW